MAEPESILQLGIEAARENKKEEARQLFRLLTRQEPDNVQGWLWLAGVAENREERQGALERVLALEPTNEMAYKGLQALGALPLAAVAPAPTLVAPSAAIRAPAPAVDADPFDLDDDPFAELDNLSDVMAADTAGPVRRAELPPTTLTDAGTSVAVGTAAASSAAASARRAESSARSASASQRNSRNTSRLDDETEPPRQGLSPLLLLLLFLIGLALIGFLINGIFPNLFGGNQVAQSDSAATAVALTAEAGLAPTTDPLGGGVGTAQPGGGVDPNATADPNATPAPVDPNATPAPVDPNATPAPDTGGTSDPNAGGGTPPTQSIDVSGANPAIIPANTPLTGDGWIYDFPQATYAASIIGNLGQFTPTNGRFVVVLIHAINTGGAPQAIPGNFFVLKDAQGRVWEARPEVSDAYVVPGVNADQTQNTPISPDGNYRSVALVFDVAPDATDLVFFARSNQTQGWIVIRSV